MRRAAMWVGGLVLAAVIGCGGAGGGGAETGTLSGRVTTGGKPVTAGTVTAHPANGSPVSTELTTSGEYQLSGVPVGSVTVTVQTSEYKDLKLPPKHLWKDGKPPVGTVVYVPTPAKYEKKESSTLKTDVKKGDNPFDLVLD